MFFNKKEPRSVDEIFTPKEEEKDTYEDMADVEIPNGEAQKKEEACSEIEEGLNALSCFGWREEKTEKWLAKGAKIWFVIMSFLYFLFGALTFAPIIFIRGKVNAVIKDKRKSMCVALGIYAAMVLLIVFLIVSRSVPRET